MRSRMKRFLQLACGGRPKIPSVGGYNTPKPWMAGTAVKRHGQIGQTGLIQLLRQQTVSPSQ